MGKKKLQLSELKVHSFITPVNKSEQKTAKGGRAYQEDFVAISSDISYVEDFSWTELKTRLTTNDLELSLLQREIL